MKNLFFIILSVFAIGCGVSLLDARETVDTYLETGNTSVLDDFKNNSSNKWDELIEAAFESNSNFVKLYVLDNSEAIDKNVLLNYLDGNIDNSVLVGIIKNNPDKEILEKIISKNSPIRNVELQTTIMNFITSDNFELVEKLYNSSDQIYKNYIANTSKNKKFLEKLVSSNLNTTTAVALLSNSNLYSGCEKLYSFVEKDKSLFENFKNGCGKNISRLCITWRGLSGPFSECTNGFTYDAFFCADSNYYYNSGYQFQKKTAGNWNNISEVSINESNSDCTDSKFPTKISSTLVVNNISDKEFRFYRPSTYEYNASLIYLDVELKLN